MSTFYYNIQVSLPAKLYI